MRLLSLLFVSVLLTGIFSGCAKDERPLGPPPLTFLPALPDSTPSFKPYPIDTAGANRSRLLAVANGLWIYFHEKGTGPLPHPGQTLTVNYHGTLDNGQKFDSSFDRGQPYSFPLGQSAVITGWDEGFQRIPLGSKAVILLEPSYGYGAGGNGTIPPNARLVFYVEAIAAQ